MQPTIKLKYFTHVVLYHATSAHTNSMSTIGVPTASTIAAAATAHHQKTTLQMLLNLQKSLDEFRSKVLEMEEEMQTVKIENNILKTKINELTSTTKSSSPSRRGFFGYGADEF
jgi:predicted 2-oxoglutarate/Fe(II)-dependent dioxygenase YbiX